VKLSALEFVWPFVTFTCAVPALAKSDAGTLACNSVALIIAVASDPPFHSTTVCPL
jgi:hypothetical protein